MGAKRLTVHQINLCITAICILALEDTVFSIPDVAAYAEQCNEPEITESRVRSLVNQMVKQGVVEVDHEAIGTRYYRLTRKGEGMCK